MANLAFLVLCGLAVAFAKPNGRIIGGQEAILGEFPHQASLRSGDNHFCGGSIIDNVTILTSAACVNGQEAAGINVLVGTNALIGGGTVYAVEAIHPHALFDINQVEYDLATLKLSTVIEFTKFIQPIEMADEEVEAGQQLRVSGWGMTANPGSLPNHLQHLRVTAISVEECAEEHEGTLVDHKNVCAMPFQGKGLCFGDAGSPVINAQKKQVGIVSWSVPCAQNKPEVFTSTFFYKGWIDGHKG